jgi:hypothetical protein
MSVEKHELWNQISLFLRQQKPYQVLTAFLSKKVCKLLKERSVIQIYLQLSLHQNLHLHLLVLLWTSFKFCETVKKKTISENHLYNKNHHLWVAKLYIYSRRIVIEGESSSWWKCKRKTPDRPPKFASPPLSPAPWRSPTPACSTQTQSTQKLSLLLSKQWFYFERSKWIN